MITIDDVVKASGLNIKRIFNVYVFGSRVYGTNNTNSDWDVIVVANNSVESIELVQDNLNIHIYTPDKFKNDLNLYDIKNIECLYLPKWAVLMNEIDYGIDKIDKVKLRHSISHKSNNLWVKCKKKLAQDDYYIGIKSLFHSFRIPIFAIELLDKNEINFNSGNYIWDKLNSKQWTWEEIKTEFKPLHNKILSDFRKKANKA